MLFFFLTAFVLSCLAGLTLDADAGQRTSLRHGLLIGGLFFGALLAVITELLSVFAAVNEVSLSVTWCLAGALLAGVTAGRRRRLPPMRALAKPGLPATFFIGSAVGIAGIALVTGVVSPPNNWDSMSYHMARVEHWIQNAHVGHYPSHLMRQHYQPPFAEMAILHLQVLAGSDRYAALVQWVAWIGSVIGVSMIARLLGGKAFTQVAAAVFAATLPMAVLQASSTQNDLVVSFFVVCLVYWLLRLRHAFSFGGCCLAGLALGLALFTKATAYVFVFPWLVWFAVVILRREGLPVRVLPAAMAMGAIALLLNAGHYYRNYTVYGHPMGGTAEERAKYANAELSPRVLLSNVSRNLVLHLEAPPGLTSYYSIQLIRRPTLQLHRWIGLDLHDSRTTLAGKLEFKQVSGNHEDVLGNFFHTLLALACAGLMVFTWQRVPGVVKWYGGLLLLSFLLYCFYLRWQIWAPRLHLPVFMLLAPYCAAVGSTAGRRTTSVALVILLLGALPPLLQNATRPVLPPYRSIFRQPADSLLFVNRPEIASSFRQVQAFIIQKNYRSIGLLFSEDTWEYPLWRLLEEDRRPYRIEHVLVDNPSGKTGQDRVFRPDCILVSADAAGPDREIRWGNKQYAPALTTPYLAVFVQR